MTSPSSACRTNTTPLKGALQNRVTQADAGRFDVLLRLPDVGAVNVKLFLSGPFDQLVVDLLLPLERGLRPGHSRLSLIADLPGDLVELIQRFVTCEVLFLLIEVGLCVNDRLPPRFDVLHPAPGQTQRQLPVANPLSGLVHIDLLAVIIAVQTSQEVATLHKHAFVHRQIDDPPRYLETHETFVRLYVPGELQLTRSIASFKPLRIEVDCCSCRDCQNQRNCE